MLAYLFAHRPAPAADIAAYEGALRRLHASLANAAIPGFITSATYRGPGAYTDWYLVEDSAALDHLNDAAVTGERSQSHALLARSAADGVGKLLRLAAGEPDIDSAFEIRFSKPPGMPYHHLYETLDKWTRLPRVALWRRMMVLGPGPEFCILCPERLDLPVALATEVVERARV